MDGVRKILVVLLIGFIAIFVQGTVLRPFIHASMIPNFALVAVVFLGLHEVTVLGAVLAFLLGVELDLFSGIFLGPWAGSFTLVFGLLALVAQRVFLESALTIFVSVLVSSIVSNLVYLVLILQFRPVSGELLTISFVEALVTAIVAPVFFRVLSWLLIPKADSQRNSRRPRGTRRLLSAVRQ